MVNVEIAFVRNLLGLESWEDCQQLGREACIGVLHILQVFRFDLTDFFRGLWQLPPGGMGREGWFELYGITPNIKTGKGTTKADVFREQVGHFLGFQGFSGVVRPDNLSDEALDASMENFKAERARRDRAANPPGSSGAGAIASTQANPASLVSLERSTKEGRRQRYYTFRINL
jgi:hypothetical protein